MIKNKIQLKEGEFVFDIWNMNFGIVEEIIDVHNINISHFDGSEVGGKLGNGDWKGSELACFDKDCEMYTGTIYLTSGLN